MDVERNLTYQIRGDFGTCWMIAEATGKMPSNVTRKLEMNVRLTGNEPPGDRTAYRLVGPEGDWLPGMYVVDRVEDRKGCTVVYMLRTEEVE